MRDAHRRKYARLDNGRPVPAVLGTPVITYPYVDEMGNPLYEKVRLVRNGRKSFYYRRPDGAGGWTSGLGDCRRIPYRLPQLMAATAAGEPVGIAEGEKDVDALERVGLTATSSTAMCPEELAHYVKGASKIYLFYDADRTGRVLRDGLVASLRQSNIVVTVVDLPGAKARDDGYDLSDYLQAGHTGDDVRALLAASDREQYPPAADGAALLDDVAALFGKYLYLNAAGLTVLASWVLHTHLIDKLPVTPYVYLTSAEKGCGKTLTLEISELLVGSPLYASAISTAALKRILAERRSTLLLDEADNAFAGDKDRAADLRCIINAGYREAGVLRSCESVGRGFKVVAFPVFGAKMIAGLARRKPPETILDRAITVELKRCPPTSKVEPFFAVDVKPEADALGARLVSWGSAHADTVVAAMKALRRNPASDPALSKLRPRQLEVAAVLVAVCDVAGADWPMMIRRAILELVLPTDVEDDSVGVGLLTDIKVVRDARTQGDRIFSKDLLIALLAIEEPSRDWSVMMNGKPITEKWIAKALRVYRRYGVRSSQIRMGDQTKKGYFWSCFDEVWGSFCLPASPDETRETSHTTSAFAGSNVAKLSIGCFEGESGAVNGDHEDVSCVSSVLAPGLFNGALDVRDPEFVDKAMADAVDGGEGIAPVDTGRPLHAHLERNA